MKSEDRVRKANRWLACTESKSVLSGIFKLDLASLKKLVGNPLIKAWQDKGKWDAPIAREAPLRLDSVVLIEGSIRGACLDTAAMTLSINFGARCQQQVLDAISAGWEPYVPIDRGTGHLVLPSSASSPATAEASTFVPDEESDCESVSSACPTDESVIPSASDDEAVPKEDLGPWILSCVTGFVHKAVSADDWLRGSWHAAPTQYFTMDGRVPVRLHALELHIWFWCVNVLVAVCHRA
ncbi:unnamed protein product [Symbiodinium microadriaticum]|nr:unnamed protein product [Symbiodinium microadriaticum]CAE7866984.1 unnamed protein product [Symbiodinium sp. KB8]